MVHEPQTDAEYEQLISTNKSRLIVVDFFATWCPPCKAIAPFFSKLSQKHKDVVFIKVDTEKLPTAARDIQSIPTFYFYKFGKKLHEFSGANQDGLAYFVEKFEALDSIEDFEKKKEEILQKAPKGNILQQIGLVPILVIAYFIIRLIYGYFIQK